MIKNIFKLLHLIFIFSKYQIFLQISQTQQSILIKILLHIISFIFYPPSLMMKKRGIQNAAEIAQLLGPIYIKFGQSLSIRPDIIGQEIADNLTMLQDKLPEFPFCTVKGIIEQELNSKIEDIFLEVNKSSVAAASVAQVHKGRLKTGECVAIKILRPNIKKKYQEDIKFLYFVTKILYLLSSKFKKLKLKEVVDVFNQTMQLELDLRMEAASYCEINTNFQDDESVYIPKVFWNLITENILVTKWVDGVSIYNKEKILEWEIDPNELSKQVAIMFFNQTYRDGVFHADLHPGNILVTKQKQLALVDFGITGRLNEKDRFAIAQILYSILQKDYMKVAIIHKEAGYLPPDVNLALFAQYCRAITEPIAGLALKDISISQLLGKLFKVAEDFGLEVQPQLILLQKSMLVIEGIGKNLNPNINMWELASPWMKKWAMKNLTLEARILSKVKKIIHSIILT